MGIMLMPVCPSLQRMDIIKRGNVQSMRRRASVWGSTHFETIRRCAFLPHCHVGAVCLRGKAVAIGETMIGCARGQGYRPHLGNPLRCDTTITTRIVSQLTGDTTLPPCKRWSPLPWSDAVCVNLG